MLCELAGQPFRCQAREACVPLSRLNVLALEVHDNLTVLGEVTTWQLLQLELSPEDARGLRRRLLLLAEYRHRMSRQEP